MTKRDPVARKAVLLKAHTNILIIEASSMLRMMEIGVIPVCAKDLKSHQGTDLGRGRATLYSQLALERVSLSVSAEEGMRPRDAVATMLKENFGSIVNEDGYTKEWQLEAAR